VELEFWGIPDTIIERWSIGGKLDCHIKRRSVEQFGLARLKASMIIPNRLL
jgi:hypothetical protein